MTERERLIRLLDIIIQPGQKTLGDIADYLLAKGVILSPVKVGETVYSISRGQIIPIQIDAIRYTERGIDIYGSNEEYFGYGSVHIDINNQIGMKWYYTKEEAEKALEEKKKE